MTPPLQVAKPSNIPLDQAYMSTKDESPVLTDNSTYRAAIGSLLYISTNTRLDIAAVTSILSRKVSKPTVRDWNEVKRVMRYLKGTDQLMLVLGTGTNTQTLSTTIYVDADWAGDCVDRKSNSGYALYLGGALVNWSCRKQQSVSLSSTEAEYVALSEACQEVIVLRRLLSSIGKPAENATMIYEDNQSAIKLVNADRVTRRSKHIETRHHYVRELQQKQEISVQYCPTEHMIADILTKPLGPHKIRDFRTGLGLTDAATIQFEEEC